ncbi:MAG TPA: AIR synthase-related protein [Acidimicrobiales bacterium]|nr:AIR synthase-related protein [Acidimicrobiales bacterium]
MSEASHASYESAGVDYEILDAAKRAAMAAAAQTSLNAERLGAVVDDRSRGESAVVISVGEERLGFVLECLGTKSMIASRYLAETGIDRFDAIGYDTVAAVVNDCCCVGALPFVVNAYFATGAATFYEGSRHASLVAGFRRGCDDAGAAWGGGESPTLSGLVDPAEIDLAGSAVGRIPTGVAPIVGDRLSEGDEIVVICSSGLHANGASLVRMVADELPNGLQTQLGSGRSFGEAILDPAVIYVRLVEALLLASVDVHYLSHITGHGLRKLMRADVDFTYHLTQLPEVPEALSFLATEAGLSAHEAYGTLNMGAGFAVYVPKGIGEQVVSVARANGLRALVAGVVMNGARAVILEPIGVSFSSEELELR